jgi:hypothetical protein
MKKSYLISSYLLALLTISPHICAAQEQEHALQVCKIPELVSYIQSFLGHADLARSAQVNRLWRAQAEHEQNERVKPLIAQHKNAQDAFMHAAKNNLVWAIHPLIKKFKANINHIYNKHGQTILGCLTSSSQGSSRAANTLSKIHQDHLQAQKALILYLDMRVEVSDNFIKRLESEYYRTNVPQNIFHDYFNKNATPRVATSQSHTEIMHALLNAWGINAEHKNKYGKHVLLKVISGMMNCGPSKTSYPDSRDIHIIQTLLNIPGMNINYKDEYGRTALTLAVFLRSARIVQALLSAGADINYVDQNGNTALTLAAGADHAATIATLLAAGANVNHTNKNGDTALNVAAKNGHTTVVQMLIAAGADINHTNNDGDTPLIQAARGGDVDFMRLAMNQRQENPSVVRFLLDTPHIDVHHANNSGKTALDVANHPTVIQMLRDAGAQENVLYGILYALGIL